MKKFFLLLFSTLLLTACVTKESNTENPRGVYKMTKLIGRTGEIDAPFDQYYICTDSITLLSYSSDDGSFEIYNKFDRVLDYTGERPENTEDKSEQIYDSNTKGFTLKWWSEYMNHPCFPFKSWCIELYEANLYTEKAKPVIELLLKKQDTPLAGSWYSSVHMSSSSVQIVGNDTIVEPDCGKDSFNELKDNKEYYEESKNDAEVLKRNVVEFYTFGSLHMLYSNLHQGRAWNILENINYIGDSILVRNDIQHNFCKISEDCIAICPPISANIRDFSEVEILYRISNEQPVIGIIADYFIAN